MLRTKYWISLIIIFLAYQSVNAKNIYISKIIVTGNKTTKEFVIIRELPFSEGTQVDSSSFKSLIESAKENLTNTSLFNYINIKWEIDSSGLSNNYSTNPLSSHDISGQLFSPTPSTESITIIINVEERWYYWPLINIKLEDRNFSSWIKNAKMDKITLDLGVNLDNMFGRAHKVVISGSYGYEKGFSFSYNNIFLDRSGRHILGVNGYNHYNKTINAFSQDNKAKYLKASEGFMLKEFGGEISYTYRKNIRQRHTFSIGFNRSSIKDTILIANPTYWGIDGTRSHTFTLGYEYSIEERDYNVYPTSGYYIDLNGKSSCVNGFDLYYLKLKLNFQYYKPLGERWFWSTNVNIGSTYKNKRAYLYDQALGYGTLNMAGYDYYVAAGQHYIIVNNSIKYLILPKRIFTMNFIRRLDKFYKIHLTIYGKLMIDAGYISNKYKTIGNELENRSIMGSGVGVDIVTYYDTVLSVSYAINKFGEKGFFFGIKLPLL